MAKDETIMIIIIIMVDDFDEVRSVSQRRDENDIDDAKDFDCILSSTNEFDFGKVAF